MATPTPEELQEPSAESGENGLKAYAYAFYRQLDWNIIGMALAIKALVFFAGWISYQIFLDKRPAGLYGWVEIWHRWDALRYIRLADKGYGATGDPSDFVGFPLLPTLIRLVNFVVGDLLVSGFVVAGIASIAAAVLLYRLVRVDDNNNIARNSAWFMLIFPTAFYLNINYTEGLFLATSVGSFLFARKGNWKLAFVFGFLACMTRLHGLVLVPALMVEAFQQYKETRKWRLDWVFIAAIPLGFAVHLLINYNATGNALFFLEIGSKHYHKALSAPWVGIPQTYNRMFAPGAEDGITNGAAELFFILLGFIGIVVSAFWLRPAYTVWIALNWLIFTSTNFILSVPRYTLSLFPLFIISAKLAERPIWYTILTTGSLLFLGIFLAQFVRGHWIFG